MIKTDNSKKHLLLGDMLELGKYSKNYILKLEKVLTKLLLKIC